MNKFEIIEVANWKRRRTFESYQQFDNKCFSMSFDIDGGELYRYAKAGGHSFFTLTLYALLKAANQVPQLRQRIIDSGHIAQYEHVAALTPIIGGDEQFVLGVVEYTDTFAEFAAATAALIDLVKTRPEDVPPCRRNDIIVASCIPWFSFTAISQANFSFNQSNPVIAWGKMKPDNQIPFACQFNHSLIDGLHIGRFVNALQEYCGNPGSL